MEYNVDEGDNLSIQKNKIDQIIDATPDVSIKQGFVSLPLDQDGFKDFISSLLGKQQEISQYFDGSFNVVKNDIQSIYYLLEQRIKQQNQAELIQFSIKITYNDDSTVTMGSLEEFKSYNELKKVISTKVNLYWSYLVKFADRDHPEKQEIELVIKSDYDKIKAKIKNGMLIELNPGGGIIFKIKHTARSWGNDIESLLAQQIKLLINNDNNKFSQFIKKFQTFISILGSILFFLTTIIGCIYTTRQFSVFSLDKVKNSMEYASNLDSKITIISNYIASGDWLIFNQLVSVVLIVSVVAAIFFGIWFETALDKVNVFNSFITLTDDSEKFRVKVMKKSNKKLLHFILSFIFSIIVSVLGNYLFFMITTK